MIGISRPAERWVLICRLAVFACPGMGLAAEPLAATDIAHNVDHVNRFQSVRNISYGVGDSRLVVVNLPPGKGPRINALERQRRNDYSDGRIAARDRVVFRSGKLRGTGILVTDYVDPARDSSYMIWLPGLRKIRRFAEPDQGDIWSGSNLTYGDVYLRRAEDETHELLDEVPFPDCLGALEPEQVQGSRFTQGLPGPSCALHGRWCYRLKSRPVDKELEYDYRITWVDRETFADYRSVFFKDGRQIKRIDKDWRSMGLQDPKALYWLYWYAVSDDGRHQGMAYIDPKAVSWNDDLDPGIWKESALRRIRR